MEKMSNVQLYTRLIYLMRLCTARKGQQAIWQCLNALWKEKRKHVYSTLLKKASYFYYSAICSMDAVLSQSSKTC